MSGNPFTLRVEADRSPLLRRHPRGYRGDVHDIAPVRPGSTPALRAGFVLLAIALLVLGGRAVALTTAQGSHYRALAEQNRLRREPLPALRGAILDAHGSVLADNEPAYDINLVPGEIPRQGPARQVAIEGVAVATGTDPAEVTAALARGGERVVLRASVPEREALSVASAAADHPAVTVVARGVRRYADPSLAPVLGYVGRVTPDDLRSTPALDATGTVGRTGIESVYDAALRGIDGYRSVERDSSNHTLRVLGTTPPRPGDTLHLTLDGELQRVAAEALAAGVRAARSPGGAVVALDPATGGVLALVTEPSFDPTALSRGIDTTALAALLDDPRHPFLNRALAGEYPSGSTAKPVIAAEALDRGVITPTTTVLSTGGITVGGDSFPDWKPGGHGVTNVTKALADSVNTFFYYVGGGYGDFRGLGLSGLLDGFERFGFGTRTGVDLVGETDGYLPTDAVRAQRGAPWYLGDTYHLAIGQGPFAVTPIQIANATAAIANGGTLYRPYVVASASDAEHGARTIHTPTPIRSSVVRASAIATVQAGMRQAVTDGSARALGDLGVPFAAKTGTAQFGDGTRTHAWFTVFGPYRNARIALTVLVEDGGEGHASALPIAHTVLRWWVANRAANP